METEVGDVTTAARGVSRGLQNLLEPGEGKDTQILP